MRLSLGLAYLNATNANIDHLRDVKDAMCKSSPNSCTRVAFEDFSGMFFCNDVVYLLQPHSLPLLMENRTTLLS